MKTILVKCMLVGAFVVMAIGMPLQVIHVESVKSLHAQGCTKDPITPNPTQPPSKVPEPTTLALVGAGIVGVGVYLYIKRRNRK